MTRTLALATTVLTFAIAGCGGSDSSSSDNSSSSSASSTPAQSTPSSSASSGGAGASSKLKVDADPSGALKFTKSSLSAKAGSVTITMDNPSDVPHGVAIDGNGVDKDGQVVNKGGTSTVTADLKPGTYSFYCPVPGHREAGMEGKLTVK
jgi:uncharacterized cupredoxin-like copper-binding protein